MNQIWKHRKNQLAIAVAMAGLQMTGASGFAVAAEAAGMEEILVTATRREQTVQEIPFNISAVSGKTLEQSNIIDSVDALRTMAGISVQDRGYRNAGMASTVVIRGINVDRGTEGDVPLAAPPTVASYVDNTALFSNFILKDIERVEVLRGPQGTLYGSGSLAGNVRYIMNKPDPGAFSGKASMNGGVTEGSSGYNLNPDVMLNIPVSDSFALRMNGGLIDNDGIVDYPHVYALDANGDPVVNGGPAHILDALPVYKKVEDADKVDIKYARVSALFQPNDNFKGQLSYQWQKDEIDARRQVTPGANLIDGGSYDDYEMGAIQLEPSEREVKMTALELEFGLGFATLTSSTSYYEHTGNGISDNTGSYARNGWLALYGYSPRPMAQAERFYDDSAWSEEVRLVSKGDNFVDWTVGLFYMDQDYDLGQNSYLVGYIPYLDAFPPPAPADQPGSCTPNCTGLYGFGPYQTNQDFLFRREQTYKENAVFGEVTFNFTDAIHLTLGGRYFDNEVGVDAYLDIPIWSGTPYGAPPGVAAEETTESDLLGKANLAWDVTANSMLYATFSQGYRHAGANAVPTSGHFGENADFLTFDSDSVDNYEIGYKGTTDNLNYSASLYYTDWQNPQLNTSTPNWGFFAAVNGESASTQGIEIELSGNLSEHLNYSLGYTYADAQLTDDAYQPAGNYIGSPVSSDLIGRDGDRLPGSAEHVFNVSLGYDVTFTNGVEMNTVLSGYYQSDVLNSLGDDNCQTVFRAAGVDGAGVPLPGRCRDSARPDSAFYAPDSIYSRAYAKLDSFQLWNLSSTFTKDEWGVSLYVKNIFNEDGITGQYTYALGGSNTSVVQNFPGNTTRNYISLPRTFGAVVSYSF